MGVNHKTKLIQSAAATPVNVPNCNVLGEMFRRREQGYRCLSDYDWWINPARSRVCARVEHSIGAIERVRGFANVHYRGIATNVNHLFVTRALAKLVIVRHRLSRLQEA